MKNSLVPGNGNSFGQISQTTQYLSLRRPTNLPTLIPMILSTRSKECLGLSSNSAFSFNNQSSWCQRKFIKFYNPHVDLASKKGNTCKIAVFPYLNTQQ
jgi:hypothetical protein